MSADGCSNCIEDPGFSCSRATPFTPDECHSTCGDGFKASNEDCDDGNLLTGDGCATNCSLELHSNCIIDSLGKSICDICGNN